MAEAGAAVGSYHIIREGEEVVLRVNYEGTVVIPSLEDSDIVMQRVIDIIAEIGRVTKIVLTQKRDYEYDYTQAAIIYEIAMLYKDFVKERLRKEDIVDTQCSHAQAEFSRRYAIVTNVMFRLVRSDPLGAYVELRRELRKEQIILEQESKSHAGCANRYVTFLHKLINQFEKTRLIQFAAADLAGYKLGDRSAYRTYLSPVIKPDFMYTKLMSTYPSDGEEIQAYSIGDTEVVIFRIPNSIQTLYHMMPPEFKLPEDKYELLDTARRVLAEHKPTAQEFTDPARMRQVFYDIGSDLLEELAEMQNINLRLQELDSLTKILNRYTIGFGLIEVLLSDERIQDITINSPMGRASMFIVHADQGDCVTNIIPTSGEGDSWASKLRLISGRPLDEANPILDTNLILPNASARIAVIGPPLNPSGLAYAFRRHRDKPWTLPLFIKVGMINPLAAGLISFLVDGSRTMLVAGTRSAGKTSLLSSVMVQILRRYRMITVEDTLELPVLALKDIGYNVQSMKVASALTRGSTEISAAEGIRSTLRLGDSALIVGEVRSDEARALYEAMRVGALANVVAGTIHGDSPYGVFDRVVNDLNVPRTSFKATDIILVANPVRSPDGLHRWRKMTQLTEVRKHWEEDPLTEGGFVDLMRYDAKQGVLQATPDLINGDSDIIKNVAGSVKEWAGDWDAVWSNIQLRADIAQAMVDAASKANNPDLLEAKFYVVANDMFHVISERVRDQLGALDSKRIFFEWNEWFKLAIKKEAARGA
ncbi:type II/IV secretion system ATPase subunit [Candidatus Woesearchaeota archaeon]|nr:type II/IV secretion system ATPase subunit [Candidatus Woesearchaeota archaeon]